MEECEALCHRLCIMTNGLIRCFGGVEHLKHKFAQGYNLTLKLSSDPRMTTPQAVTHLKETLQARFSPCQLKDAHENILEYQLQNKEMPWSALFTVMEELKQAKDSLIQEYTLSETTLEQVFIQLTKLQWVRPESEGNACKKCCACCCQWMCN